MLASLSHNTKKLAETREMCSCIDMQTHAGQRLGFDLWRYGQCIPRSCHVLYVWLVADSSSCFPFIAQTDRQKDTTEHPTHTGGSLPHAGMDNKTQYQ